MTINKYDDDVFKAALDKVIVQTSLSSYPKTSGKVRDIYDLGRRLLLVTTDRLSAFDRNLTTIPFKGQVLNQISKYWFDHSTAIARNHMVAEPYGNAMLVKKIEVFPVEFIVRGYITGTTNTSLWTLYQSGERQFSGTKLPESLKKNQKLPEPLLTPTTKSASGDEPVDGKAIVNRGLMTEQEWQKASSIALSLFDYAQQKVANRGLILADTKFEFGKDKDGHIVVVDELLTPDSSRYWNQETYANLFKQGREPENFDKEVIRLWYKDKCNPYKDKDLPKAPDELRIALAKTYVSLYEMVTGKSFDFKADILGEKASDFEISE